MFKPSEAGMIQRFARSLFEKLKQMHATESAFQVHVSFLEIHNEDIHDLLAPHDMEEHPFIREDNQGRIYCTNVREERVHNAEELLG